MKSGQDEFFAIIGEGAALLKSLDENSPGFFDDLNRLREIVAMLGGPAAAAPALAAVQFSLADREASAASLRAYLQTGIAALPPELAAYEARTVAELAQLVGDEETMRAALAVAGNALASDENRLAAYDDLAGRGLAHSIDLQGVQAAAATAEEVRSQSVLKDPAYLAARAEYEALSDARLARLRSLTDQMTDESLSEAQRIEACIERDALLSNDEAQTAAYERLREMRTQFHVDQATRERELLDNNGADILSKLAAASPVEEEAAQAWAHEQVIDDDAKAKLKRLKYKPEDVIRDMAEFYRLTGGKASAIRISAGGKRANAVGVTTRTGEKVINLGTHFNKTVLFHELAHHLENDPIAQAASNGFLLKRRESATAYRLRDLTGNKGYATSEIAWKDSFMDPYVGKIYRDGVTEVFSMGVQYLANPKDAALFAAKDPEMFNLITGYLAKPLTPAMSAKLNMHAGVISDAMEKQRSVDELYERAMAYLASRAPIIKDDWFEALDRDSADYRMLDSYVLYRAKKGSLDYIGHCGKYLLFSGVLRNRETKRNGKGYMLVDLRSDKGYPDTETMPNDLEAVQALVAVADYNGTDLWNAYYGYFRDNWVANRKQKVIDLVGMGNLA